MPLCERCMALYLGFFCGGIVFVLFKAKLSNWSWGVFLLGWIPLVLDGMTQLLSWRESSALLRTSTGALAGIICSVFFLQKVRCIMEDAASTLKKLFELDLQSEESR